MTTVFGNDVVVVVSRTPQLRVHATDKTRIRASKRREHGTGTFDENANTQSNAAKA